MSQQKRYMMRPPAQLGLGAILAIVAACASFLATCSGHPVWGLVLALLSLPLGLAGFIHSVHPQIRGGVLSIVAVILGGLGIIVAVIGIFFGILVWPFR
jgi:hypothetical protein